MKGNALDYSALVSKTSTHRYIRIPTSLVPGRSKMASCNKVTPAHTVHKKLLSNLAEHELKTHKDIQAPPFHNGASNKKLSEITKSS